MNTGGLEELEPGSPASWKSCELRANLLRADDVPLPSRLGERALQYGAAPGRIEKVDDVHQGDGPVERVIGLVRELDDVRRKPRGLVQIPLRRLDLRLDDAPVDLCDHVVI